MKFSATETIKRAEEEYGLGSGQYFKVKEGDNRIRLLSPCVGHQGEFNGTPTFKFVCWILDRSDGKVKLYFMPVTVLDAIGALQMNPEYAFEDVPMPYDVTINAKNAGKKEVVYTVVAARNNTPLTTEESAEYESKPSVEDVVKKLRESQKGESEPPRESVEAQPPAPLTGKDKFRAVAESLPRTYVPPPPPKVEEDDLNAEDIPF